ncbi:MAG: ribonuclease HII [Nitrosomonas sp.]|nr:ribonuclease HII [Nitrosomonas sp.]
MELSVMYPDKIIYGVDEAGRGPLAGAVYAACVALNPEYVVTGLTDSKKLTATKREALAKAIKCHATAWSVACASVAEIDQLNILQASLLAMQRAVKKISLSENALILVDGIHAPRLGCEVQTIIRGDSLIAAISAASILAKTTRDAAMLRLHARYPMYGFDRHKGYPTKIHLAAIQRYGISDVHRRSFAPCGRQV